MNKQQTSGYPVIVIYPDTLPIRLDKLHLWEHWGSGITRHYLDSPIRQFDEIQILDFIRGNRN